MAGFGKKNAKETMLRAVMIHTAAEVLGKEAEVARVLYPEEVRSIFKSVVAAQDMEATSDETNYAMVGARTLINNREFVQEIMARWGQQAPRLEIGDIRRSQQIFTNTVQDFTGG